MYKKKSADNPTSFKVLHSSSQNQVENKMALKYMFPLTFFVVLAFVGLLADAEPAIAFGYNPMQICLENCAVCKKMLGTWFEGPRCAEACIRHRGAPILDCEDFASIAPFLTKIWRIYQAIVDKNCIIKLRDMCTGFLLP